MPLRAPSGEDAAKPDGSCSAGRGWQSPRRPAGEQRNGEGRQPVRVPGGTEMGAIDSSIAPGPRRGSRQEGEGKPAIDSLATRNLHRRYVVGAAGRGLIRRWCVTRSAWRLLRANRDLARTMPFRWLLAMPLGQPASQSGRAPVSARQLLLLMQTSSFTPLPCRDRQRLRCAKERSTELACPIEALVHLRSGARPRPLPASTERQSSLSAEPATLRSLKEMLRRRTCVAAACQPSPQGRIACR